MALIDEDKLQGNVIQLLEIAKKNRACCDNVAAVTWANSSLIMTGVFVTIAKNGKVVVYTAPGGTVLTPAEYGVLSKP